MADPNVDALLAGLWAKNRDVAIERLGTVRAAVEGLRHGELDDGARTAARAEAHKLAGALGMYGFPEGSAVAARLEDLLTTGSGDLEALTLEIDRLDAELRG